MVHFIESGSIGGKAITEWLHLNYKKCLVCNGSKFFADAIVAMPMVGENGSITTSFSFTAVPICCASCGHTIFVSATSLKLIPSVVETKKKNE